MTYTPHSVKVEGKVVDGIQSSGQGLSADKQVPQISAGVAGAHLAATPGIGRPLVLGEAHVLDIQAAF
jgi:hypothetical protein